MTALHNIFELCFLKLLYSYSFVIFLKILRYDYEVLIYISMFLAKTAILFLSPTFFSTRLQC